VAFAGGTLNVVGELGAQKKTPLVVERFAIGNQQFKSF
jgi:hypothetical protein